MSKIEAAARVLIAEIEDYYTNDPAVVKAVADLKAALAAPPPSDDAREIAREIVRDVEETHHETRLHATHGIAFHNRIGAALTAAEARGKRAGLLAAAECQPSTAENPNESEYQRGYFNGVMAYRKSIRAEADKC